MGQLTVTVAHVGIFTTISAESISSLLADYNIGELIAVTPLRAGSVNSNFRISLTSGDYFLRIYEEQPFEGAKKEAQNIEQLAHLGVPVARPLFRQDGGVISQLANKPAAIFQWVVGQMICQRGVREAHLDRVGGALARIHRATVEASLGRGRFCYEDLVARTKRIAAAGREAVEFRGWGERLEAELLACQSGRSAELPQGLIHGDLFRDNVLFRPDREIAALLDFESASVGTFAYDFMVTLLSWCFGDSFDENLARALRRGYERERAFEASERAAMWSEGCFAALRFTVTRITDYAMRAEEGTCTMKDWRRFRMRYETLQRIGADGLDRALA